MRAAWRAVPLHAVLAVGAVLTLTPLVWMVSASLMPTDETPRQKKQAPYPCRSASTAPNSKRAWNARSSCRRSIRR